MIFLHPFRVFVGEGWKAAAIHVVLEVSEFHVPSQRIPRDAFDEGSGVSTKREYVTQPQIAFRLTYGRLEVGVN